MKIWIDLTNSPHVNVFNGMIKELQKEHDLTLTCRTLIIPEGNLESNFDSYAANNYSGLVAEM